MALDRSTPTGTSRGGSGVASAETLAGTHFGRLVATRRSDLGLSREELALRMGTSKSTVERIENGQPPGAEVRKRLAAALSMEHEAPVLDPALITPRVGVALVAAIVAVLWLSTIVLDAHWVRLGVAAAIVAALWLSTVMERRGTSARVPAMVVVALWLSVIAVGFLSNGGHPLVSNGRGTGIEAASAAYGAVLGAPHGAVLGAVASPEDGQGGGASAAPAAATLSHQPAGLSHRLAGLSHHPGGCGSPGAADGPAKVLAFGIDPFPWTGALVIYSGGGICAPQSRITLAGVRSGAVGDGLETDSRESSPATAYQEGSSTDGQGGVPDTGQAGSSGGNHSASNTLAGGHGGGGPIGNTVSSLGATVSSLGNTVNSLGQALRKP
jgi:transcriptional regulator with XRE-family HTH domain